MAGMDSVRDGVSEAERRAVETAVHRHVLPSFVRGVSVDFGQDHDGDPAVWILFHLDPDEVAPLTPDRLAALKRRVPDMNALSSVVRTAVADAAPGRLAYTRFVAGTPADL